MSRARSCFFLTLGLLLAGATAGQSPAPGGPPARTFPPPDPDMARPIDAVDTVFIEDMTWLEVRDAMRAGKKTVIVATGGVEQNGPYLVTGKHNVILRATTEAIARKLGSALVAPIIGFVPEGDLDPPSGHMKYPGTITLTAPAYKALLTDVALSMKAHGFLTIVMIGDSGGNQNGMQEVAGDLNAKWSAAGVKSRVLFVPEYYDYNDVWRWVWEQGIREVPDGTHDDYGISAMMMVTDPASVRLKQRAAKGKAQINGVSLLPAEKTIAFGKRLVDYRANLTVAAIKKALGE